MNKSRGIFALMPHDKSAQGIRTILDEEKKELQRINLKQIKTNQILTKETRERF